MGLTSSIDIDLSEYPTGIIPEQFVGSLTRDTAFEAGDFAEEDLEETLDLTVQPVRTQTGYELKAGWNIFSWPWPYEQDVIEAFTAVLGHIPDENDLILMKNNDAQAYLPEWNFNAIGNFVPGQGYQIKIPGQSSLVNKVLDFPIKPSEVDNYLTRGDLKVALDNTSTDFLLGWNIIGTGRLHPIDASQAFKNMRYFGYPNAFTTPSLPGTLKFKIGGTTLQSTHDLTTNFDIGHQINIAIGKIQHPTTFRTQRRPQIQGFVNNFTASISPITFPAISNISYDVDQLKGHRLMYPTDYSVPVNIRYQWSGSNRAQIIGMDIDAETGSEFNKHFNVGEVIFWRKTGQDEFPFTEYGTIVSIVSNKTLIIEKDNIFDTTPNYDTFTELPGTVVYQPRYTERDFDIPPVIPFDQRTNALRFPLSPIADIHGTNTNFSTDYTNGDRIVFTSNEKIVAHTVENIHSDTSMSINIDTFTGNLENSIANIEIFDDDTIFTNVMPEGASELTLDVTDLQKPKILGYFSDTLNQVIPQPIIDDVFQIDGPKVINGPIKVQVKDFEFTEGTIPGTPEFNAGVQIVLNTMTSNTSIGFVNADISPYNDLTVYPGSFNYRVAAFPNDELGGLVDGYTANVFGIADTFNTGAGQVLDNLDLGDIVVLNKDASTQVAAVVMKTITSGFVLLGPGAPSTFGVFASPVGIQTSNTIADASKLDNIDITALEAARLNISSYSNHQQYITNLVFDGTVTSSAYHKKTFITGADIENDIQIIKNNDGHAYFPQYNYNAIGNLNPGEGYQMKINEAYSDIQFAPHDEENRPLIDR